MLSRSNSFYVNMQFKLMYIKFKTDTIWHFYLVALVCMIDLQGVLVIIIHKICHFRLLQQPQKERVYI